MPNRNDQSSIRVISSLEELVSVLRQCNQSILSLHQYSSDDFKAVNGCIRYFHEQANAVLQGLSGITNIHSNQKDALQAQAKLAIANISHIVTKLQFHDIIRQKLEHVQDTNQYVMEELLLSISNHSGHQQYKYIPVIPDIVRLHAAQLIAAEITYRQTFAEINMCLQSIGAANCIIAEAGQKYSLVKSNTANENTALETVIRLSKKMAVQVSGLLSTGMENGSFSALIKETSGLLGTLQINIPATLLDSAGSYTETLQSLKNLYTMESERVIFDQVIRGEKLSGMYTDQEKDTDENIELF